MVSLAPPRSKWIRESLYFCHLEPALLERVSLDFQREEFAAGHTLIHEGDDGDRLYVLAEGSVEVLSDKGVLLTHLGRTSVVGELALLGGQSKRNATVRTLTPVVVWSLEKSKFDNLVQAHPALARQLSETAQEIEIANFLRTASHFQKLEGRQLRRLAARLRRRSFAQGAMIIKQGVAGDSAFLLMTGRVEVRLQSDGEPDRNLSTLDRGSLFGESALLTDAPRNASVYALESCEVLELTRADLLNVLSQSGEVARCIVELMRLRQRPLRLSTVAIERVDADGEGSFYVLKNPTTFQHFKLSEGATLCGSALTASIRCAT